jgi:hypothetical protein
MASIRIPLKKMKYYSWKKINAKLVENKEYIYVIEDKDNKKI